MITSSGARCDGCKKYILPIFNDTMQVYAIPCTDAALHSHSVPQCNDIVKRKSEIMTDIVNAARAGYIEADSAEEDLNTILEEVKP